MSGTSLAGQRVVVTGAARGIGAALAARAVAEGAQVLLADLNPDVHDTAAALEAQAWQGDCASNDGIAALLSAADESLGGIDIFFANAGIEPGVGLLADDEVWERVLNVNVMAHVRTARALIPRWLESDQPGRLVVTASAAGLLTMLGSASYSVSKHGAVALAEWLHATYAHRGITMQAICPQGVQTAMYDAAGPLKEILSFDSVLTPEQVAQAWVESLADDRFLVLPHPEVARYYAARAGDTDRWLAGMNKVQQMVESKL